MKTAEQIYMEVQERLLPRVNNYTLPDDWQLEAMKEYAKQVALSTLKHASEIALMKFHCGTFKADTPTQYHQMGADNIQIDKQSILNAKIDLP